VEASTSKKEIEGAAGYPKLKGRRYRSRYFNTVSFFGGREIGF